MTTPKNREWPENLFAEINPDLNSSRLCPGAGYLALHLLYNRSNTCGNVIKHLYLYGMTETETAYALNLYDTTVHYFKQEAIAWLQKPIYLDILTKGTIQWAEAHAARVASVCKTRLEQAADDICNALNTQMRTDVLRLDTNLYCKTKPEDIIPQDIFEKAEEIEPENPEEKTSIKDIDMSVRTYNILTHADLTTLGKIAKLTESEFGHIRNVGRATLEEVAAILETHGLQFHPEPKAYQS